jgi:hypothetical protein
MSIKDTLTNNSMNSFSFGGKTYTRRVDNGAVVYDISAGTDGSAFSTGWVDQDASGTDVANGANLTFVHNLGTTDIVTSAFVNSTASDTNAQQIPVHEVGTYNHGYAIVDMDANSITVNLADDGYYDVNSSGGGTYTSLSAKFLKLVIVAKMGSGGGGGTPAGSDRELQFNDNGTFGSNTNLRFDGSTAFIPRLAIGEGNVSGDEGGEIFMSHAPNGTLAGPGVAIDIWQNRLRIFEYGSPFKGAYIDLSECDPMSGGTFGTNLLAGGGGGGSGGGGAVQSFQVSTPLNFTSRNIHQANFASNLYGEKLSVSDFTETANTIGGTAYQIDQAAGSGGFKMFKVPSSGGPYLVEVDALVYDADNQSGDRFTLGLYTCDSETGVTAETDNSVAMTEVAVGYNSGGSSTQGVYGTSNLQTSNVIANGKFFYLRINSLDGGNSGYFTGKIKVTNLSGGGSSSGSGGGLTTPVPNSSEMVPLILNGTSEVSSSTIGTFEITNIPTGTEYALVQMKLDADATSGSGNWIMVADPDLATKLPVAAYPQGTGKTYSATQQVEINKYHCGEISINTGSEYNQTSVTNQLFYVGDAVSGSKTIEYRILIFGNLSGSSSARMNLVGYSAAGGGGGGSGGGGASVTTDPTAPTNPSDGDLWYDEDGAALYVYTDSIGGWIQANGGGGGGSGPRAYVEFDGTASNMTAELSASNSFNVSSITDHQAGQYTVTFTSPVPNPVAVHDNSERSDGYPILYSDLYNVGSNSIKIGLGSNNLWYDSAYISLIVF